MTALPLSLNSYATKHVIKLAMLGSSLSPVFHQPQAATKSENLIQRDKINKLFPQNIRNQQTTQKDHLSREGSNSNNNINYNNNVNSILIPNYQYCSHIMELICLATEQCYKFSITQSSLHSLITHTIATATYTFLHTIPLITYRNYYNNQV